MPAGETVAGGRESPESRIRVGTGAGFYTRRISSCRGTLCARCPGGLGGEAPCGNPLASAVGGAGGRAGRLQARVSSCSTAPVPARPPRAREGERDPCPSLS
jgi:hypothetical protein